jgi:hypothetical protein
LIKSSSTLMAKKRITKRAAPLPAGWYFAKRSAKIEN